MKNRHLQITLLILSTLVTKGVVAKEQVFSRVVQACYTDEVASPQITTFLKEHSHKNGKGKDYTLLINRFEQGRSETLETSGYRPVMIEGYAIHNPLFEISLSLKPLSRRGLKSRNLAEGHFTDPRNGKRIHFKTEMECAVRTP